MAWQGRFFSKNLEVGDAGGLAGLGVDAFDGHLFEHPLTIDFLGGDDFEAFYEAAVQVVSFDAAKAILVAAGIPLLSALEEYA